MTFVETLRAARLPSLTVFGDSITVGLNASVPDRRWADLLATAAGIPLLRNKGVSGTILQNGPMADGQPRLDNGLDRHAPDLLGADRSAALAILYGYNDARYVAAPQSLNAAAFLRAYATLLEALLKAGIPGRFIAIGSPPYPSDQALTVGSPGFAGQSRAGFALYVSAVKELAATYGVPYAKVYEAMSAYPDGALSSPDHTHPNDAGHAIIAQAFAAARVI